MRSLLLRAVLATAAIFGSVSATATLPHAKIRGVNLGGLFVVEPWMMEKEVSQAVVVLNCPTEPIPARAVEADGLFRNGEVRLPPFSR